MLIKTLLSLLLAVVHGVSGITILIVSSWFIAACALAGLNFNYVLPAAIIRGLALLRIGSGYAFLCLSHDDFLSRTKVLRSDLFNQLKDKLLVNARAHYTHNLAQDTDTVAKVWMSWVAQQATAVVTLVLILMSLITLGLNHTLWFYLLVLGWLCLSIYLCSRGIAVARMRNSSEAKFLHQSESFLNASGIWSLYAQHPQAPSARLIWHYQAKMQKSSDSVQWCLTGLAFGLTIYVLMTTPVASLGQPLVMLAPILLLSVPDWLGRSLVSQTELGDYLHSRHTLQTIDTEPLDRIVSPACDAQIRIADFSPTKGQIAPVTIDFPHRGIVMLYGESGTGKSMLMKSLVGLQASQGKRYVGEYELPPGVVQQWHYVEQLPHILNGTLKMNLSLGDTTQPDEMELRARLSRLGLGHFSQLNLWLGEGGWSLSGGEKKRLALAQLLATQPHSAWFIDEPFEGLDQDCVQTVVDFLCRESAHRLIVIASHITPAALEINQQFTLP